MSHSVKIKEWKQVKQKEEKKKQRQEGKWKTKSYLVFLNMSS